MADEQTPPKRDVNELFTLDASEPPEDSDGPLAHLLSSSPVADLGRRSTEGNGVEAPPAASPGAAGNPPNITDVAGLEDLFATTADLPATDASTRPSRPGSGHESPAPQAEWRPVADPMDTGQAIDPLATFTSSAGPPGAPGPLPFNPTSTQPVEPGDVNLPRPFEVGGKLRFSTEAGPHPLTTWPPSGDDRAYPAVLVPNAVPAPVAPSKSVRGPGQERRRGVLSSALVDLTERRSFLGVAVAIAGLAMLGLLAAGDLMPNPLADDRTDVVAESGVPSTSASGVAPETSADDTSSSTGAGSPGVAPDEPSSTVESPTSLAATTSARRVATTARPTVRSTTTAAPTTTTTTDPSSTTEDSSTSSTTDTSGSSTTDPNATTTSTTEATSSTETTDTTEDTTTTDTTEDTTTTDTTGSSSSSDPVP